MSNRPRCPSGAEASGKVVQAVPLGRFKGGALLRLALSSVTVNGDAYDVQTTSISRYLTPSAKPKPTREIRDPKAPEKRAPETRKIRDLGLTEGGRILFTEIRAHRPTLPAIAGPAGRRRFRVRLC